MESMKDYMESPDFKVWLGDDEILRVQWVPGTNITAELAKQSADAVEVILKEKVYPFLVLLDGIKGMDREARLIYSGMGGPSAVALVGVSPIARVIGNLFIGLNKQTQVKLRMFATEEEATKWLKGQ
jgi:hypothetical protein